MNYINENVELIKSIKQEGFNITNEFKIASKLLKENNKDYSFLRNLQKKVEKDYGQVLSRKSLKELIKNDKYSAKEEFFMILCWGIFFTVAQKKPKTMFLNFYSNKEEEVFEQMRERIRKTKIDKRNVENLFKIFSIKDQCKIPGLDYAYYTKLFYFFSGGELPILDQWTTKAYAYLLLSNNTKLYLTKSIWKNNPLEENKTFRLRSNKAEFYYNYVIDLNELCNMYDFNIDKLETFLFGWDLRKKDIHKYENPRVVYMSFFHRYFNV